MAGIASSVFDRGHGVVVALHGHDDDPSAARSWGRELAPPGWEVVAPGSPFFEGVRSWFETGPRGADPLQVRSSVARVADLVERLHAGGSPVVVAGFSQGGAMAMALARSGVPADAYISICGFHPEVDLGGSSVASVDGANATTIPGPVLVLNTSNDEIVPAFLGADGAVLLSDSGLSATVEVVAGGHEVNDRAIEAATSWLATVLGPRVRISLGLPVDRVDVGEEFLSARSISDLAVAYERLGFDAAYVTDHPAPDDRWLAGGGHQALEPTVALGVAAVATKKLRLHTNVYVLPYRNPFLAAKALASVQAVSQGRLILGVAAGYVKPEFEALGVSFDSRGAALEESLQALPRIWTGDSVALSGQGWSARGATIRPGLEPSPPIWVGGNSTAALRRAIQFGDGWSPMPTPPGSGRGLRTTEITDLDGLAARLDDIPALCDRYDRQAPLTVCFVPFSLTTYLAEPASGLAALVEEVGQLRAMGVDWVALSVPGESRAEVIANATELATALHR